MLEFPLSLSFGTLALDALRGTSGSRSGEGQVTEDAPEGDDELTIGAGASGVLDAPGGKDQMSVTTETGATSCI